MMVVTVLPCMPTYMLAGEINVLFFNVYPRSDDEM